MPAPALRPMFNADVQSIRMVDRAQVFFALARQAHHFEQGFVRQFLERGDVLVGHHHDVAVGVGKAVEDDEIVLRRDGRSESLWSSATACGGAEDTAPTGFPAW